jgi:hypothetical protein
VNLDKLAADFIRKNTIWLSCDNLAGGALKLQNGSPFIERRNS